MATKTKTVRMVKQWLTHLPGEVFSPNAPIADLLIKRKMAEAVEPKPSTKKPKLSLKQASA